MEHLSPLFNAILGSAGAAFFGLLLLAVKWLFAVKKNISTMVENGKNRAEENRALFQIQRAQLEAQEATLEVVAKIRKNGNVSDAMESIKKAKDIYDKTMDSKIGFREPEEVKK